MHVVKEALCPDLPGHAVNFEGITVVTALHGELPHRVGVGGNQNMLENTVFREPQISGGNRSAAAVQFKEMELSEAVFMVYKAIDDYFS